ncbi:MAG TPA: FAD-dependent tricarballylate dehydrogenase TcuA [Nocardioidaceae bacterium]|nr:FAD-dependent tricarballylate dehydrogenase TcuA [Nocardioidaceae bacterium]
MANDESADVVIVGGGSAGFAAAVASRQAGAERVILLEKGIEELVGGNARYSHTGFRFTHTGLAEIAELVEQELDPAKVHVDAYPAEDFEADLERVTQDRINPTLARLIVDHSNASVNWMKRLGFRWALHVGVDVDGVLHYNRGTLLYPEGGGVGQMEVWQRVAREHEVDVRYRSSVTALHGTDMAIEGVQVSGPEGPYDVTAPHVILCSGGFQASAQRRAAHLGKNADLMKVRGSRHNTGEVLQLALDLGASSAGQWQGAHATPIDGNSPAVEVGHDANRYAYQYGITVNEMAQRFFDEGEADHSYTYAKTGWAVLGQQGGVAYQVFDQQMAPLIRDTYYAGSLVKADSVKELAVALGLDPVLLEHTVDKFNAATRDDVPFNPSINDGRGTAGLSPDKSNWAVRLEQPPFYGMPVTGGITFTFGGLEVDERAQVRNTRGEAIKGLYASGDIVGLFFHNYPSMSGQIRNSVFSRLAGAAAGASPA